MKRFSLVGSGSPVAPAGIQLDAELNRVRFGAAGSGIPSSAPIAQAFAALEDALQEASSPGWDGYGALPVGVRTAQAVRQALVSLPGWLAVPEIIPEPGGTLALDWEGEGGHLSVSIDENSQLYFSARFVDGSRRRGAGSLAGGWPADVLSYAHQAVPDNAPYRRHVAA